MMAVERLQTNKTTYEYLHNAVFPHRPRAKYFKETFRATAIAEFKTEFSEDHGLEDHIKSCGDKWD